MRFSADFYHTGTQLLLKEKLSSELTSLNKQELDNKFKLLKIGIVQNTTTFDRFKNIDSKYSYQIFDTRLEVFEALDKDEIEAFATDALIVQTLLNKKFKDEGYTFYPKDRYLPELDKERYAIAFDKKSEYSDQLESLINTVLDKPRIKALLQEIKKQEGIIEEPKNEENQENYWLWRWIIIGLIVALILIYFQTSVSINNDWKRNIGYSIIAAIALFIFYFLPIDQRNNIWGQIVMKLIDFLL